MVGRPQEDTAGLDRSAAGLPEPNALPKESAERRGPEGDDDLRPDRLNLGEKVWATRGNLIGLRTSVAGRAALDDVRDVGFPAREAGCLQGLIENHARRPNEGTTRGVFLATRCLADQDDGCIDGPFPGDRMDASRMEAAPGAGPNGRGNLVESLSPFSQPDQGARWRDPVLRRLHDLRSETRFVRVRIFG